MGIFLSNLRSIFSFHCHSCIVNEVIFEDDTWFFSIFFYFTDILPQFNRISPSCVTKRYHFMDVKRIFLLKQISSTFFYQMSIYLILTNMYTNKLLRTKRTPQFAFFFLISSLAYILSKVYIFKKQQPSSSEKKISISMLKRLKLILSSPNIY